MRPWSEPVAVRSNQTVVPGPGPDELCCDFAGSYEDDSVRYVARPALAQGRLEVRGDGRVKWSLRRPWRDGTRAFVFDPLDRNMTRLKRLVALVPHPREHQLTYFGVLGPTSPLTLRASVPKPPTRAPRSVGPAQVCA